MGNQPISYAKSLLPPLAIGAAGTFFSEVTSLSQMPGTQAISAQAVFTYVSGGTTAKAYLQTSLDGGATWIDIMSFAFATASATKVSAVNVYAAAAAALTPTDGTLTDNTILNGVVGERVRVKVVVVGTYTGATTLAVSIVQR